MNLFRSSLLRTLDQLLIDVTAEVSPAEPEDELILGKVEDGCLNGSSGLGQGWPIYAAQRNAATIFDDHSSL